MYLLHIAVAFAVLAVIGLIVFFTISPLTGILMILAGEVGAFISIHIDQRTYQGPAVRKI